MLKFDDVVLAFEFASSAGPWENEALIHRSTGAIYYKSEVAESDEMPADIGSGPYVRVPHKNDLDLGRALVFRFVADTLPDQADVVGDYFRRPGGYARFKDLLSRKAQTDAWFRYEEQASAEALRTWIDAEGLAVDG